MAPLHRPGLPLANLVIHFPRRPMLSEPCQRCHRNFTSSSKRHSAPSLSSIPPSKQKYVPSSGTYPRDFLVSGTHVGVKPSTPPSTPDLALITSKTPCSAAAVFTQNRFQAAPVVVSRQMLERRRGDGIRAIVVNSGCANAVTGQGGTEDAHAMGEEVDRCLGSKHSEDSKTLVMSTGVIGQRLPIQKILSGISPAHTALTSSHASWLSAATAICTTDTFTKLLSTTFTLPSHPDTTYSLAGMTKGAGMIHPNMATLLGILCTDAAISPTALRPLLAHAAARSFNSISIDGDTSTNDTVALLANGAASPSPATQTIDSPSHPDYAALRTVLTDFAQRLSHLVVRDGEGATKFVTIRVSHAPSYDVAHRVASSVATSPLVKTALYGKDANWGRILCAVGYTPALPVDSILPAETSVSFLPTGSLKDEGAGELKLLSRGEPEQVDEERAARYLAEEDLEVWIRLRTEEGEDATVWTCDFSHEYVTINGDYRT